MQVRYNTCAHRSASADGRELQLWGVPPSNPLCWIAAAVTIPASLAAILMELALPADQFAEGTSERVPFFTFPLLSGCCFCSF